MAWQILTKKELDDLIMQYDDNGASTFDAQIIQSFTGTKNCKLAKVRQYSEEVYK